MTSTQTQAALEIAFTALGVATGAVSPVDGARRVLRAAPGLVPVEDLKEFLTDRDRIFAELAADVAEQIKVGSSVVP